MIIAVDFDGTMVTHEYPEVGLEVDHSIRVIRRLQDRGHKIILYTMRHGKELDDAIEYCQQSGIELFGINTNPDQHEWTMSPKCYAHIYIDDAALGCPLVFPTAGLGIRPWADWEKIEQLLTERRLL